MESLPSSAIPRTFGRGTAYLAARSFLLSLIADDNAFASWLSVHIKGLTHLLSLSIQQICRQSTLLYCSVVLLLDVPLVVSFELLFHLNLFRVSLGVMQFSLVTKHLLRVGRRLVGLSSCPLSPKVSTGLFGLDLLLLLVIHTTTMSSSVLVHVVILYVRPDLKIIEG
jgi:hypothetical protein